GYLFPATYSIKESTTIESLIDEMLAAMDKNLSPYYSTIKSKNLTVNELLTIASLVEKEGAKTEDRKLIAGVFYNRLNRDMPLQSNIAILYAQGKLGQNISLAEDVAIDTNIDSP
ncbi:endolytic transglycosylase MltG, partial [Vibrio cholerae O1]|nr:endolytic transglycosylase MltG [Vibrio cholerae O1]